MTQNQLINLLERYQLGILTEDEHTQLVEQLIKDDHGLKVPEALRFLLGKESTTHRYDNNRWDPILAQVLSIDQEEKNIHAPTVHRIHFLRRGFFRYAAAVVLVLGIAAYIFTAKQNIIEKPAIVQELNKEPGTDKATLTLSDGQEIILDNSTQENIADGSISIEKNNGTLTYNSVPSSDNTKMGYNTMSTPRGGQYQLVLPDGSKVWLNSTSSLKYPTIFQGENRIVELIGEAYFDIKANKKMPFVVKTQKAEVLVLGTEFNINSYSDEPEFSTTLINGSIKVSAGYNDKVISPGQQAQISNSKPDVLTVKNDVDISRIIAWQKGIFEFNDADITKIARQLSRWYDVKIIAEQGGNNLKFGGGITKKTTFNTVLKVLEANGIKHTWQNGFVRLYTP